MLLEEVEISVNERIQSTDPSDMAAKALHSLREEVAPAFRPHRRDRQDTFGSRPISHNRYNVENNSQRRQVGNRDTGGSHWRESSRNTSATSDSRWRQSNSNNQNYYNRKENSNGNRWRK